MSSTLDIRWEHSPDQDDIFFLASDTGKTFCELLSELLPAFVTDDILLKFSGELVPGPAVSLNRVSLNGRLLDDILMEIAEEQRRCEGRRCEMELPIRFPSVTHGNKQYIGVPELLLRKVFIRAAGIV